MKEDLTIKRNNNGFTLVELIVVLVILAILAAVLVPALLGYIDEAKKKQDLLDAKNLMNATQSTLSKLYAERLPYNSAAPNILRSDSDDAKTRAAYYFGRYGFSYDVFKLAGYELKGTKPSNTYTQKYNNNWVNDPNVWTTVDNDPYFVCVGLGDYNTYANPDSDAYDIHKAYTVYFIIYQKEQDSIPIIYDGKDFINENPFNGKTFREACNKNTSGQYEIETNGGKIKIQFYMLKCKNNSRAGVTNASFYDCMNNVDNVLKK